MGGSLSFFSFLLVFSFLFSHFSSSALSFLTVFAVSSSAFLLEPLLSILAFSSFAFSTSVFSSFAFFSFSLPAFLWLFSFATFSSFLSALPSSFDPPFFSAFSAFSAFFAFSSSCSFFFLAALIALFSARAAASAVCLSFSETSLLPVGPGATLQDAERPSRPSFRSFSFWLWLTLTSFFASFLSLFLRADFRGAVSGGEVLPRTLLGGAPAMGVTRDTTVLKS